MSSFATGPLTTPPITQPQLDLGRISRLQADLAQHPMYQTVQSPSHLACLMSHHVVAVFDFMTLLKSLQCQFTCVTTPWTPPSDPVMSRFLNEVVLGEESDMGPDDQPISHFGWYLKAMEELGVSTAPISGLVNALSQGQPSIQAVEQSTLPQAAKQFCITTFEVLQRPLVEQMAVFFYAREDLIPAMFLPLVEQLQQTGLPCHWLVTYLQRHIEVDGDSHGPIIHQALQRLLTQGPVDLVQCQATVERSLQARLDLWQAIQSQVEAQ